MNRRGTLCFSCEHLNDHEAANCAKCGAELFAKCPKCGQINQRGFLNCTKCEHRLRVESGGLLGLFRRKRRREPCGPCVRARFMPLGVALILTFVAGFLLLLFLATLDDVLEWLLGPVF